MKTHTHHITPRSRGGSDDPENLIDIDFVEHARIHAEDFLAGGPEFDFRHAGWKLLDEDLQRRVREEKSRRKVGNGGNFGEGPPTALGKSVWNNGVVERRSAVCPGVEWVLGRLYDPSENLDHSGDTSRGKRWWNDGWVAVRSVECPGPGWVEGQLPSTNEKKGRPGVPKPDDWKQKMREMRQGDRNPCAGRRWVTNGQTNIYLKPGEETPENFKPGRTL